MLASRKAWSSSKNADEPAFYNTVWSLRLVRCLILLPICVVAALPVAGLYQTPILGWILPVVGVYFVLGGLASLSPVFLQRRLQFARLNLFQFSVEAITTVSQIIFAYLNPTVWAVIFGGFVGAFANAVGTYLLMPGLRHRFYVSKEYAWQVFLFGRWIFISSAIFFVSSNFDNVYLGTVVPLSVLGVYGIARNIAELCVQPVRKDQFNSHISIYCLTFTPAAGRVPQAIVGPSRKVVVACSAGIFDLGGDGGFANSNSV